MRGVADELGVEAMSLYHHVPNKDAMLDGMLDLVMDEVNEAVARVDGPDAREDCQGALRARILAAREVMLAHPWAPTMMETRTSISVPVMAHFEAVLGIMRAGRFSWDLAHHAMHALGSRAMGFTQELFESDDPGTGDAETEAMMAELADVFPNMVGMVSAAMHDPADPTLSWCDDQYEFTFALDLLLDGLERRRAAE